MAGSRKADIQASLTAAEIPWTPKMTVAELLLRKAAAEHDPTRMSRAEITALTIAVMRELAVMSGISERLPASPRHADYVNAVFSLNEAAYAAEQDALSRTTLDVFGHVAKFIKSFRDKMALAVAVGDRAAVKALAARELLGPKQVTYISALSIHHRDLTRKFMSLNNNSYGLVPPPQVANDLNPADNAAISAAFSETANKFNHIVLSSFRADDVFAAGAPGAASAAPDASADVRVQVISALFSSLEVTPNTPANYYIRDPDFPYIMLHVFRSCGYIKGRVPGDVCIGYYHLPVSRAKEDEIADYLDSPDSAVTLDRFSIGFHWLQLYANLLRPTDHGGSRVYMASSTDPKGNFAPWRKALARKVRALNRRQKRR